MPHSAPNIPESQPGNLSIKTLNGIVENVKGTTNTSFSSGIEASSTSSGTSFQVENQETRKSFWAMITRRLRYFNKPSLSYLRISLAERIRKFSKPTTTYDVEGLYNPTSGLWIKDNPKTEDQGIRLYRNPWDSYDGYIQEDGTWEEANPSSYYPAGWKNDFYYMAKETRYVMDGATKAATPFPSSGTTSRFEYYCGYCPQYFWCYSWCELVEDINLMRPGQWFFKIDARQPRQWEIENMSRHPAPIISDPDANTWGEDGPLEPPRLAYWCREWNVAKEHTSQGGIFGSAMGSNRAHEVNNSVTLTGQIVRMYPGKGSYYLFVNPQVPNNRIASKGIRTVNSAPYQFWASSYTLDRVR